MPSFNKLQSKKVVIVGGSSGIGRAVAQGCLEFGATVIIVSSNKERLDKAIQKLEADSGVKGKASGEVLDLTKGSLTELGQNLEARLKMFRKIMVGSMLIEGCAIQDLLQKIGKFDHFVHTAGETPYASALAEIDLEKASQMMRIRHDAALAAARAIAKHDLINAGGSITLCSGTVHKSPIKGWTPTVGVTGAVVSLATSLAVDLAPKVRSNVVTPGPVATEFWGPEPDEMLKEHGKGCLTGKVADPLDTAEAFLYCMRDGSVTGSTIMNDCGSTIA